MPSLLQAYSNTNQNRKEIFRMNQSSRTVSMPRKSIKEKEQLKRDKCSLSSQARYSVYYYEHIVLSVRQK